MSFLEDSEDKETSELVEDIQSLAEALEMDSEDAVEVAITEDGTLEPITESVKATRKMVVRSVKQKRAQLIRTAAMKLAKSDGAPEYKLYRKHLDIAKKARAKISKKYGAKARAVARTLEQG